MTAADLDDFGHNIGSTIRRHWVLFLIPGVVMAILGLLAAASPFIAKLARDRRPISAPVRGWKRLASIFLLSGILGSLPAWSHAAGLECPEIGPPHAAPNLLTDVQAKLVASGNSIDLANEIYDLINKRQIERPNISYADPTDILIAAYCPVVANLGNLTASEKLRRMRQFDTILQQQLAANMTPPGSLIIANVPLPPDVYHELRSQAASIDQTPAQLMTAILSRAAGK